MHFKGSLDSSTAVVACDDNIFDVEGLDRILQYSQEVDVWRWCHVGYISVDE